MLFHEFLNIKRSFWQEVVLILTPWVLGCDWLRWITGWSASDLVLGGHTELVLVALHEVSDLVGLLRDGATGDEDPALAGRHTALKMVACDWWTAIFRRGLPADNTVVLEDLRDPGSIRLAWWVWNVNNRSWVYLPEWIISVNSLLRFVQIFYWIHNIWIQYLPE